MGTLLVVVFIRLLFEGRSFSVTLTWCLEYNGFSFCLRFRQASDFAGAVVYFCRIWAEIPKIIKYSE